MAYILVNKKGKQMLLDDFPTIGAARQAQVNLIHGAKLGANDAKANKEAIEYLQYRIEKKK